jgi:hypothetical protein
MKNNKLWHQVLSTLVKCASLLLPTILIAACDFGVAATVLETSAPVNNGRTRQK